MSGGGIRGYLDREAHGGARCRRLRRWRLPAGEALGSHEQGVDRQR